MSAKSKQVKDIHVKYRIDVQDSFAGLFLEASMGQIIKTILPIVTDMLENGQEVIPDISIHEDIFLTIFIDRLYNNNVNLFFTERKTPYVNPLISYFAREIYDSAGCFCDSNASEYKDKKGKMNFKRNTLESLLKDIKKRGIDNE